jgi:hypothetical protein
VDRSQQGEGVMPVTSHCTPDGRRIATTFDYPPIPIRCWDWAAYLADEYDGAPDAGWQPVGHGATEAEAIADLLEQIEGEIVR